MIEYDIFTVALFTQDVKADVASIDNDIVLFDRCAS